MRCRSVLAVAAVLVLVGGAAPAFAADGPVSAAFPDIEVPVGGSSIDPLGPSLWSIEEATLTGVQVAYRLTGLTGVRITPSEQGGGDCTTPSSTRVTCTDPRGLTFEGETVELYLPVDVTADRTAEPGDTGKVTITVSADGLTPITGVSTIRVTGKRQNLPVTGPATAWLGLLLLAAGAVLLVSGRVLRRPGR
ncbi:hypothetical protein Q0Z83_021130 [Actinoplanes sichuanensis]|uniref:LPXTG-motif cell wall anchor domain-containing protein n=1 Tax=Actinoplanes sichuanensis TaxID=512349 RepID=A0ABW4AIT3_9ACTN|nr:hypothetical protein [Actinoplanes sichuanensis]BEL03922.1 hypothetical protein Q0Z83_021130 [Actinoplanes sichuanensis]